MSRSPRRHAANESGSALVIVLAFVLVVAIVLTALLREARANFASVGVTKSSQNRVYAANAGIDWGIQALRRGMSVNGSPICAAATTASQSLGSMAINGRNVSVTCQVNEGQTQGAGGWAVFITDASGSIATQSGGSSTKQINGAVYNGGGADGWSFLGGTTVAVRGGDVVQQQTTGCTSPGSALSIGPTPAFGFSCQRDARATPLPPLTPELADTPPLSPLGTTNGNCRVFAPGRYTAAPQTLATPGTSNYLRSGVYLLDNAGILDIHGLVVGGIPAPGDTRVGSVTPCASETAAETGGHYGVLLVLGGNSKIQVEHQAKVELHSYIEPQQPATPGLTIYQVPATATGPMSAHRCTGFGPTTRGLETALASSVELIVHGHIYTPSSRVSAFGGSSATVSLLGGVVAAGLDLQANAAIGASNVSIQRSTGQRTITLQATSDRVGDEKAVSTTAVVDIANDPERTATVQSWTVRD